MGVESMNDCVILILLLKSHSSY